MNKGPVIIVSNMYPPHVIGGAEIVAHRQAAQLALRGWDVAAFTGRFAEGSNRSGALELEEFEGLPVYRINHVSFEPDANFRWQKANQFLASIIESRRPKLVHFHNPIGLGAELIRVAKRMGVKVVVTLHDHWGFCFKNTLIRNDTNLFERFILAIPQVPIVPVSMESHRTCFRDSHHYRRLDKGNSSVRDQSPCVHRCRFLLVLRG